jgi:hypothetical protein
MSVQIEKPFGTPRIAGGALIVAGGLLLAQRAGYLHAIDIGRRWLFANTMTNWAYAELYGPIILTGASALMIIRAIGHRGEWDRGISQFSAIARRM